MKIRWRTFTKYALLVTGIFMIFHVSVSILRLDSTKKKVGKHAAEISKGFDLEHIKRSGKGKGVRISNNGSMKVSLSGLFLPDHRPSDDFMKDPIINEHSYKYLNKPPTDLCADNQFIDLLVAVISSASNFDQRKLCRRKRKPHSAVVYLFFLGMIPDSTGFQERVDNEAARFNDIVQEDFVESSRNLSLKTVAVLKWVTLYCPNVKFVLKKDDDVKLSIYHIMFALQERIQDYQHFIMGNSKYLVEGPIRDAVSKYYTSVAEFQGDFFPMFVHGPAYGFPGATAKLLYQATLRTKLFWLEDVYITGICAHRANIPIFFHKQFVYEHVAIDAV